MWRCPAFFNAICRRFRTRSLRVAARAPIAVPRNGKKRWGYCGKETRRRERRLKEKNETGRGEEGFVTVILPARLGVVAFRHIVQWRY